MIFVVIWSLWIRYVEGEISSGWSRECLHSFCIFPLFLYLFLYLCKNGLELAFHWKKNMHKSHRYEHCMSRDTIFDITVSKKSLHHSRKDKSDTITSHLQLLHRDIIRIMFGTWQLMTSSLYYYCLIVLFHLLSSIFHYLIVFFIA